MAQIRTQGLHGVTLMSRYLTETDNEALKRKLKEPQLLPVRRGVKDPSNPLARLAFADAALAVGTIADFTLASGSSWPLSRASEPNNKFKAMALCAIDKDALVSIVKYWVRDSSVGDQGGGLWGAKPCGSSSSSAPVTTPCDAVTGGALAASIPLTIQGVTGSLASLLNAEHTLDDRVTNCARRLRIEQAFDSAVFGTSAIQVELRVDAVDAGLLARWDASVAVRFGSIDGGGVFTIAGPAAFTSLTYQSSFQNPTVSNEAQLSLTPFGAPLGSAPADVNLNGSSVQVW